MPGIRLIVSYADLNQGHEGKIYQASNWLFVGKTGYEAGIMLNGKLTHRRTINSKYGTSDYRMAARTRGSVRPRVEGKPKLSICFRSMMKLLNASNCYRNVIQRYAPQVKPATRLESIQERAGQHGPWRSNQWSRQTRLKDISKRNSWRRPPSLCLWGVFSKLRERSSDRSGNKIVTVAAHLRTPNWVTLLCRFAPAHSVYQINSIQFLHRLTSII